MSKSIRELDRARSRARRMVLWRAVASGATAGIPIPGASAASVAADGAMLFDLLPRINRAFGLSAEQIDELDEQTREQFFILAGKLGNAFIGKAITEKLIAGVLTRLGARVAAKSAAGMVPVVGSVAAIGISFGMMRYVGNAHVEDCYRLLEAHVTGKPLSGENSVIAPAAAA